MLKLNADICQPQRIQLKLTLTLCGYVCLYEWLSVVFSLSKIVWTVGSAHQTPHIEVKSCIWLFLTGIEPRFSWWNASTLPLGQPIQWRPTYCSELVTVELNMKKKTNNWSRVFRNFEYFVHQITIQLRETANALNFLVKLRK